MQSWQQYQKPLSEKVKNLTAVASQIRQNSKKLVGRSRVIAVSAIIGTLLAGIVPSAAAGWSVAMSRVSPLFERYFDGTISFSKPSVIADPASFRSVRTSMDFPLTFEFETLIRRAAVQVGMEPMSVLAMMFPSLGLGRVRMDTSISDADIIIRRRAVPGVVKRGIFSPVEKGDPEPAWDFRTDLYNTTIYYFLENVPEDQALKRRPWLRIERARVDTVRGITTMIGEGYSTFPYAHKVELPIKFYFKQSAFDKKRYYFRIDSEYGVVYGDWIIGGDPAYIMHYNIHDAKALCLYMWKLEGCGTWNYHGTANGVMSSDVAFKRNVYDTQYTFTLPMKDRPIKAVRFKGRSKGVYVWDPQRIDVSNMDGDGNAGKVDFKGQILLRENRYVGHFEYKTDDLNALNLMAEGGNAAIPPGGATFVGEIDIPYDHMDKWNFDGDFRFQGYKMNQVEQGRSFMRWLKITEDGADADEMVFAKTQGIGLEIKRGSGGRVAMRNGKLYSPLFAINTETMIARFSGKVDLVKNSYDMYMKFQGLKQVDRFIARVPIINFIINRDPDSSILDLNFQITGPLKAPLFKPVYTIPDVVIP